jgi:glyoxylase-like metal-dependent hydrolase (beta-lactamase superfamily II)
VDETNFHWQRIVSQPFDENSYLAFVPGRNDCLIFDPGFEPDKIVDAVRSAGLVPSAIINTHGHSDHIAGNAQMKQIWPDAPLVVGAGDAEKLVDPQQNLSAMFGIGLTSPPADQTVQGGDTYQSAGITLSVRETPGHSAGHVVFLCEQADPWVLFGGDVLFRGSVGRSDFPDGDWATLVRSIQEQVFTLPDDTVVLPGHGPPTTVGEEKRHNPFVGGF